ncbi:uncharacterized protein TNCV_3245651 [Trichonephila clavipes]|nr:uncharacterized protein TNCV_3245651 [Trichonephila clavipes]
MKCVKNNLSINLSDDNLRSLWMLGTSNLKPEMSAILASKKHFNHWFRRLVEGEERWKALTTLDVLPQYWGGNELNRTVTCMVLKATNNDGRHLALCHDEFRGPRSGLC